LHIVYRKGVILKVINDFCTYESYKKSHIYVLLLILCLNISALIAFLLTLFWKTQIFFILFHESTSPLFAYSLKFIIINGLLFEMLYYILVKPVSKKQYSKLKVGVYQ
jgi:hypothetical protein